MSRITIFGLFITLISACDSKDSECQTDDDCASGETCVISHDHEGDDHDHGGICEGETDTAS